MPDIPLNLDATDIILGPRAEPSTRLEAFSGLLIVAGSMLITIAALIKWWPISPVLLVVGAVVFWTYVAVTAKDEPTDGRDVLVLRDA